MLAFIVVKDFSRCIGLWHRGGINNDLPSSEWNMSTAPGDRSAWIFDVTEKQ